MDRLEVHPPKPANLRCGRTSGGILLGRQRAAVQPPFLPCNARFGEEARDSLVGRRPPRAIKGKRGGGVQPRAFSADCKSRRSLVHLSIGLEKERPPGGGRGRGKAFALSPDTGADGSRAVGPPSRPAHPSMHRLTLALAERQVERSRELADGAVQFSLPSPHPPNTPQSIRLPTWDCR